MTVRLSFPQSRKLPSLHRISSSARQTRRRLQRLPLLVRPRLPPKGRKHVATQPNAVIGTIATPSNAAIGTIAAPSNAAIEARIRHRATATILPIKADTLACGKLRAVLRFQEQFDLRRLWQACAAAILEFNSSHLRGKIVEVTTTSRPSPKPWRFVGKPTLLGRPHEFGLFVRSKDHLDRAQAVAKKAGVPFKGP